MYRPLLEQVIAFATREEHKEALAQARKSFFAATGEVFEDDPLFETCLASFIEWYVLDHREGDEPTWSERFLPNLSLEELQKGAQLAASLRSLYTPTRIHSRGLYLTDLLGGGRFLVTGEIPPGLRKNDIFEGRIIPWGDTLLLSRTMIFHPFEAREVLLRQVSELLARGEGREAVLARLWQMRLRFDRYRNIPLERIYNSRPTFQR